jgi:single-strand DNA-binding protein
MNGLTCALTGRLGSDPERKYTTTGKALLAFSIAVDENTTATEDRAAPETTWVRVTLWSDLAEQLGEQLHKGSQVYVEGKLRLDRWTDKRDSTPRAGLSVNAWRCELHGAIGKNALRRRVPEPAEAGGAPGCT